MLLRIPRGFFCYDTIYRHFLAFFSRQTSCILPYLFFRSSENAYFFREQLISFFSNEAVNLCLFLTHAETVFRGTPYFVATYLLDNSFSTSFKGSHFSAKDLFSQRLICQFLFFRRHLS